MSTEFEAVVVPDLGANGPIKFVAWLVERGATVIPGERIAELLADGSVFQLDSPAEGKLTSLNATAGQVVAVGETIARVRREE